MKIVSAISFSFLALLLAGADSFPEGFQRYKAVDAAPKPIGKLLADSEKTRLEQLTELTKQIDAANAEIAKTKKASKKGAKDKKIVELKKKIEEATANAERLKKEPFLATEFGKNPNIKWSLDQGTIVKLDEELVLNVVNEKHAVVQLTTTTEEVSLKRGQVIRTPVTTNQNVVVQGQTEKLADKTKFKFNGYYLIHEKFDVAGGKIPLLKPVAALIEPVK